MNPRDRDSGRPLGDTALTWLPTPFARDVCQAASQEDVVLDHAWWSQALAGHDPNGGSPPGPDPNVEQLKALLRVWLRGFAQRTPEVADLSLTIREERGLHPDEAGPFLRAIDEQLLHVDTAGFVTPLAVRGRQRGGRYALFSRDGNSTRLNLEYIIQLAVAAELVADHQWPASTLQVEHGEFDAIGFTDPESDEIILAVEAKARARGRDSLEGLLKSLEMLANDSQAVVPNNAANKYRALLELSMQRPVVLYLVAAGARWKLDASYHDGAVRLSPRDSVVYGSISR